MPSRGRLDLRHAKRVEELLRGIVVHEPAIGSVSQAGGRLGYPQGHRPQRQVHVRGQGSGQRRSVVRFHHRDPSPLLMAELAAFVVLTFAVTWAAWLASAHLAALPGFGLGGPVFLLGVFAPAIVALLLTT